AGEGRGLEPAAPGGTRAAPEALVAAPEARVFSFDRPAVSLAAVVARFADQAELQPTPARLHLPRPALRVSCRRSPSWLPVHQPPGRPPCRLAERSWFRGKSRIEAKP